MTVYTENEEEARLNYFSNLSLGGWCAFKDAAPYAHWLIEATPHPLGDESAIIRPVSNNNGTDQQYQWWRPAVFSCVPSRVGAIKT